MRRTHAVHACTQYALDMPSANSCSSISTKNFGFELPAHVNTASGASPPYGSHTASSAATASRAVASACEYAANFCAGETRRACPGLYEPSVVVHVMQCRAHLQRRERLVQLLLVARDDRNVRTLLCEDVREGEPEARAAACYVHMLPSASCCCVFEGVVVRTFPSGFHFLENRPNIVVVEGGNDGEQAEVDQIKKRVAGPAADARLSMAH